MFTKILVGFDDSTAAWDALQHAIQLARQSDGVVWILSVEEPLPHYASALEEVSAEERQVTAYFDALQGRARSEAAGSGVAIESDVVRGHASQAIVDYARQIGADLIVVGQHGHAGVLDRMLGSTSDRIVDTATCSVLVVPAKIHHA